MRWWIQRRNFFRRKSSSSMIGILVGSTSSILVDQGRLILAEELGLHQIFFKDKVLRDALAELLHWQTSTNGSGISLEGRSNEYFQLVERLKPRGPGQLFSIPVKNQRGNASDPETPRCLRILLHIKLGDFEATGVNPCQFFQDRCELATRRTGLAPEIKEHRNFRIQNRGLELRVGDANRVSGCFRSQRGLALPADRSSPVGVDIVDDLAVGAEDSQRSLPIPPGWERRRGLRA